MIRDQIEGAGERGDAGVFGGKPDNDIKRSQSKNLDVPSLKQTSDRLWTAGEHWDAICLLRSALASGTNSRDLNDLLLERLIDWRARGTTGPPMPAPDDYEGRIEIAYEGRECVQPLERTTGAGDIVTRDNARFQRMFDGTLVLADGYYGSWMTRLIAKLGGHHEPQEERVFADVLKHVEPDGFMLELGCYWGFYSAMFLRHFDGRAEATLVEPALRNLAVALETLRINRLSAQVQLGAVVSPSNRLGSIRINKETEMTAPPFSVSEYMLASGRDEITILHADIQGAESELVRDLQEPLGNRAIKYLFLSTHSAENHIDCLKAVRQADYFLVAEHDTFESFSYDGLVAARSPDTAGPGFIDLPLRNA